MRTWRRIQPWLFLAAFALVAWLLINARGNLSRRGSSSPRQDSSATAEEFLARKERWAIKTGADDTAPALDILHPAVASVRDLVALTPPEGRRREDREGAEDRAYVIDAKLLRFKQEEDDDDYHIVITDWSSPGPTMIVEIPDPDDVPDSSPWKSAIARARTTFQTAFSPTHRFTRETGHIRVTGIGFFDFVHGQSGVAPNGIELHPVIKVEILD